MNHFQNCSNTGQLRFQWQIFKNEQTNLYNDSYSRRLADTGLLQGLIYGNMRQRQASHWATLSTQADVIRRTEPDWTWNGQTDGDTGFI